MSKRIVIEPVSRLEGEARITILLNERGEVQDAFFQVVEFRGFEQFCVGRPVEELPRITSRICGVCPWAHHLASVKATDMLFGRNPPPVAHTLRELGYMAHVIHSHALHFFWLAAPDFLVPTASRIERSIIGILREKPEIARDAIEHRVLAQRIQEIVGGKATHPVAGLPGGWSKPLSQEELDEIRSIGEKLLGFAERGVDLFEHRIWGNSQLREQVLSQAYYLETYYAGLVQEGALNLYDGRIRVVDPRGSSITEFEGTEYLNYIAEQVLPWSYTKAPYLKQIGWKGLKDGADSGVYRVGPLARLNAADCIPTPRAQERAKAFFEAVGGKPVHHTLLYHWARVIEILYCAERLLELCNDPQVLEPNTTNYEGEYRGEGVGVVEAPRGLLIHHYRADENAITTDANMIVATTMNNPAICLTVRNAARHFIRGDQVDDRLLNAVEIAFRAYDPCLACSTHSLPGTMPLTVDIFNADGQLIARLSRSPSLCQAR